MAKGGSKSYEPASVEKRILEFWFQGGYFHPEPDERGRDRRYCIMIPPPNVTAALHLGHALNNTLQDILIRRKRMAGCNTFWLVGTDHAGIATQATVEKALYEREHKTRHDLGRDELVRRIWDWKHKHGGRIVEQLKRMGCSCDYERERFTLDEVCAKAVRHTFFKLFRDGLIYRGKRLVNWDTQLQTAVADDEVYHETVKGHFYHFKYPVKDPRPGEPEFVHLATTRPETMLGDTAVAVHPEPDRALDKAEAELKAKLAEAPTREKAGIQAEIDNVAERRQTVLPTLLKLRDMARDGRQVILPLVDRPIPLICDEWARPELGSGCVKITPAHDPNDYEVGQRHNLPMVSVLTGDGKVAKIIEPDGSENPNSSRYEGLRFATKGREKVVEDMQAAGLVERIEDRMIEIGHSDRSKTPIEPFLSDQWFVKMGDLTEDDADCVQTPHLKDCIAKAKAEPRPSGSGQSPSANPAEERMFPGLAQIAIDAVKRGDVRFFPPRYEKTYLDWLSEKRDWCIGRQLWWGHRIPIWKLPWKGPFASGPSDSQIVRLHLPFLTPQENKHVVAQVVREREDGLIFFAICVEPGNTEIESKLVANGAEQDPDVLDTWFSSALWPHSTLGWPDADPQDPKSLLGFFYPTQVLSTAREIITLWVARMVMTGLYNVGAVPFSDVVIHPLIMDGQGRKMSKTAGNGVDPVDIIEEYGADALRFTLAELATETQDIRMPVRPKKLPDGRTINVSEKFEKGRNFCNKLWQAATGFVMRNLEGYAPTPLDPSQLALEDRWILSRLAACLEKLDQSLDRYQFSTAVAAVYGFMWDEYCSWYIEMSKPRLSGDDRRTAQQVLVYVLDQLLRALHPIIPFVTEAVWTELNEAAPQRGLQTIAVGEPALVTAAWPGRDVAAGLRDEAVEARMAVLQEIIKAVRDIRAVVNDYRSKASQPSIRALSSVSIRADAEACAWVGDYRALIQLLAGCEAVEAGPDAARPDGAMSRVIGAVQIFVPVADLIDRDEVRRCEEAKLAELQAAVDRAQKQLSNENFVSRADPAVVEQTRQRLDDLSSQIQTIRQHIADLE